MFNNIYTRWLTDSTCRDNIVISDENFYGVKLSQKQNFVSNPNFDI